MRRDAAELVGVIEALDETVSEEIEAIAERCAATIAGGGKLLFAGNGGSAAQSQHFAAELVCRLRDDRGPYAAVALTTDTSFLTACANDYGFERVFARQIDAIGREGDVLFALSTSGRSPNVVAAVEAARRSGLSVIALTGAGGGAFAETADHAIVVPHDDPARIQEAHLFIGHVVCAEIEARLESRER